MKRFSTRVVAWQWKHGRHGLPWQANRDPYRVWLSEIMLQQTQVAVVLPYYARFLARFPDVQALAAAPLDDVLQLWAGLGYYTRARNLHGCACAVVEQHGGRFPASAAALAQLPGIGRSTAAAIAAFCFAERVPILDGNVKRVLARHFAVAGDPGRSAVAARLWELAERELPSADDMAPYTQGLMDLGAILCTRTAPACGQCPLRSTCEALRDGRVDDLPARRRPRAVPLRRVHWLLPVWPGGVLLARRAPTGLWGGLYAPPEFDAIEPLRRHAATLGAVLDAPLAPRRHGFTHFSLEYTVHAATLDGPPRALGESGLAAVAWTDAESIAVPAPVRTLLRDMRAEREEGDTRVGAARARR